MWWTSFSAFSLYEGRGGGEGCEGTFQGGGVESFRLDIKFKTENVIDSSISTSSSYQ